MLHHKPDIELKDIRGNVPTRIQKLRDGQFDAILLAKAGVDRLGLNLDGLHVVALDLETFVPAPAQGALALQCRSNDEEIISILSEINDTATQELLKVERTVLNRLNGGCQLPLGVYAHRTGTTITAHVAMAKTWDTPLTKFTMSDENADTLIEKIMERLSNL
jgi:hydroxymethylbilane synthase